MSVHQEIDEYELVDPVDILTPLEKSGFWDGVVSASLTLSYKHTNRYYCCDFYLSIFYHLIIGLIYVGWKVTFCLSVLIFQKAAKWSERKEAVAELNKLASTKRIAPGDFTEICMTLE